MFTSSQPVRQCTCNFTGCLQIPFNVRSLPNLSVYPSWLEALKQREISVYIPSTQPGPCKLFWWPVPTFPAIAALLNLDLRLSALLPLHLTYAMENKVNICQRTACDENCPSDARGGLIQNSIEETGSSAPEMTCFMAWVILIKTNETHRQTVLFSQLTAALHNALASANIFSRDKYMSDHESNDSSRNCRRKLPVQPATCCVHTGCWEFLLTLDTYQEQFQAFASWLEQTQSNIILPAPLQASSGH